MRLVGCHADKNLCRFQRTACFQLLGFINHQRQNNTKFAAVEADQAIYKTHIGKWANHDPEAYAYANYGNIVAHLFQGTPFKATNVPPGYEYQPWTIQGLLDDIESGKTLQFTGDWA